MQEKLSTRCELISL